MASQEPQNKDIDRIDPNQQNIRRLVEQIQSPLGIVPFVGAGLSVPFSLPSWQHFLSDLGERAGETEATSNLMHEGKYEEVAELLLDALAPLAFNDELEAAFGDGAINEPSEVTAVELLPRLAHGPVITTNVDRVLERVFTRAGQKFERIVWGATPDSVVQSLQLDRRFLLKVHGDVEDSENRVLTRSEYNAHYDDLLRGEDARTPFSQLLQRVLESRSILFVGCSLQDDRIVEILRHAADRPGSFVHYAVVPEPSTREKRSLGRASSRSEISGQYGIRRGVMT